MWGTTNLVDRGREENLKHFHRSIEFDMKSGMYSVGIRQDIRDVREYRMHNTVEI
jgi:hypothetical protein